jgi:hypothetical protein
MADISGYSSSNGPGHQPALHTLPAEALQKQFTDVLNRLQILYMDLLKMVCQKILHLHRISQLRNKFNSIKKVKEV